MSTLHSNDMKYFKKVSKHLHQQNIPHHLLKPKNYQEALTAVNKSHLVIGMRLHACIFAAICEKPFIAIAYSSKVYSFAKIMDLEKMSITVGECTPSNLIARIDNLLKNYPKKVRQMTIKAGVQKLTAQKNADLPI